MTLLRWGIASAGKISHDFVTAVGTLPPSDHKVVAVAARSQSTADTFAKLHEIPQAYEGYEHLANDRNVDVVYVGTLNPQHYEVARLMLENGKHVLCEKPLCMNTAQVAALTRFAAERKLFLMEAIWSRFFPSYQYVRKQICHGAIGEVREVDVRFGFPMADVARLAKKDLGGGTVLDLGVYVIQVAQWAFESEPTSVNATGVLNEHGCDTNMVAILNYANRGKATIETSSLHKLSNKAVIKGTKGQITINDFWSPTSVIAVDGSEMSWPLPDGKHKFNHHNSAGLRYEAEEVRRCIKAGRLQCEEVSHDESLIIARIEDEIRKQIGVVYPADEQ